MTTYKALAIVDDVNTCDCCGKSNLKCTVAMESSDGEIVNFGTVCAARHSGRDLPTIKREIADDRAARIKAALVEFQATDEYRAHQFKLNEARRRNIGPGRAFKEFCVIEQLAAQDACALIAARHGVRSYEIHA